MPYQQMWWSPESVDRVLTKLDATPEEMYRPARVSRQVKLRVDRNGYERELRFRQVVQAGRDGAERLIALLRCQWLPQPPLITMTEGCQPGRFRADLGGSLCGFELMLDPPLEPGQLGVVEYAICMPPGQADTHHSVRVQPGTREVALYVSFDPTRRPLRCTGYRQAALGLPAQPIEICGNGAAATAYQYVAMDPAPGIYGIQWEWP